MKTSNLQATCKFPAGAVVRSVDSILPRKDGESDEDFTARDAATRAKMAEASALEAGDAKEAAVSELVKELLPDYAAELTSVGVKLPSDTVDLNLRLGNFLFDLYMHSCKAPANAPLALAIHQKRLQDLAARLDSDEFELSKDEISIVKTSLIDEAKWATVNMHAYVQVGEEKRYLTLNHNAAGFFASVVEAAVNLVMAND